MSNIVYKVSVEGLLNTLLGMKSKKIEKVNITFFLEENMIKISASQEQPINKPFRIGDYI